MQQDPSGKAASGGSHNNSTEELFIIICSSGFEDREKVRSALMFATLASTANYRTILFCIQNAVDVMVKGEIEKREALKQDLPAISQRLSEAVDAGVEILCCSQTMGNKKLKEEDLIQGVKIAGAMSIIALVTEAKGTLCF